jgi:predicted Fe-S protein YdhL (DUF1289 family)
MDRRQIETPCVRVCVVDAATNQCEGCGRTLAEIGGWMGFSDERRRAIMAELPARLKRLNAANADA